MRVVLDTNFVISALTERDESQRIIANDLLREAAQGTHELLVPQCVLFEISFVLLTVYGKSKQYVAGLLAEMLKLAAVTVVHEFSVSRWLELWPDTIADAPDAAVAIIAARENAAVATFDKTFARRLSLLSIPLAL